MDETLKKLHAEATAQYQERLLARVEKLFDDCGGYEDLDYEKLSRKTAMRLCAIEETLAMLGLLPEGR